MGRPPKPVEEVRTDNLAVRLTKDERRMIEGKAKLANQKPSVYMREAALER